MSSRIYNSTARQTRYRKNINNPENSVEAIKHDIIEELFCSQAKFPEVATKHDFYMALAYAVRHRLLHRWIQTAHTYFKEESRTVVYLSAEYLLGPLLGNNLLNMGIYDQAREAVDQLGLSLDELLEQEEEPGLGNGGLGRLAACFMDSLATLEIPTIGYGIRYEYGIFDQEIHNGWQVEVTDKWLHDGNPWEIPRPEIQYCVNFGGHSETYTDEKGNQRVRWIPRNMIMGTPYDTPILGYAVKTANMLRLWKADARESLNLQAFNVGDYYRAVEEKVSSENISRILYPNDQTVVGRELRLQQEYFFVSCSLQDMIRIHLQREKTLDKFHEKYTCQLNDTHPAISIAELMRLLMDVHGMAWDKAWHITTNTFAYTNHTLLPEALEKWPLSVFQNLLPRHTEIIYEINSRFLEQARTRFPGDDGKISRLSLIEEGWGKQVRMANLACVGSMKINGVAELHSKLLKQTILKDFHDLWPEKFNNKTNGVTPRRFMVLANPSLSKLISSTIGDEWIINTTELGKLAKMAFDRNLQNSWQRAKQDNKNRLSEFIKKITGIIVNEESIFDIQVKRIHEYKRQHMNVLHVITMYNRIKQFPNKDYVPRTFIFGGKAAPGYYMAKLIIKLINSVAEVINKDRQVNDLMKVVFLPDFNVKNAQRIYPAADLSEQISTAGMEASGTGNMKFSMNGALTIGTLDGANVEIREEVGSDNFFLFGLTTEEVLKRKLEGYRPSEICNNNPELSAIMDQISCGMFSEGDGNLFRPLTRELMDFDRYMLFADYVSYLECQDRVSRTYQDMAQWAGMSILNVARIGKFSSDRAIKEYCQDIWHVKPTKVDLPIN
ncbi:MAG: glycogen/starch/alpha-glucan phosphorylase [Kiritimatiellae bacterium]|nr:glycogen/starch/alpha-glucan phosphorylase [Kiritimatiellia bacterium]